ncbi:Uncharacterised protein [uncultured archaeon]|nr:Uncharacterised protein [uncultured archaeon]
MLEKLVTLVSIGPIQNVSFGDLLAQWEQYGLFAYILPFLIIFAFVFGILIKLNLFGEENRSVSAIIGLAVGLISLQFGFVSQFFAELFPRFGIGIAVVLVGVIMMGLFIGRNTNWIWLVMGIVAFAFVVLKGFGALGWGQEIDLLGNAGLLLLVFVIILIAIMARRPDAEGHRIDTSSPLARTLNYGGAPAH